MKKLHTMALCVVVTAMVAACSPPSVESASEQTDNTRGVADEMMKKSRQPLDAAKGPVKVSDDIWLGSKATSLRRGRPLPSAVESGGVTLSSFAELDIVGVANLVETATGIPTTIDEDIMKAEVGSQGQFPTFIEVDYKGKLSKFLDKTSNTMGINWRYEDGEIHFFLSETVTYFVKVLPATSQGSVELNSSGGESGSNGNSSQSSSSAYEIDIWSEMVEAITDIVATHGTLTASKSTGTLSVSAPNSTLRKVDAYIIQQNERLSKQVAVNVQVFNVNMSDTSEFGTDFGINFRDLDLGSFDYTANSASSVSGGSSLGWTLLEPLTGIPDLSGVIKALKTKGDVSVVTTANATTLNNVPTPIQVGNNRTYVSSITEVVDELGDTSTELETDNVSTGFNMQMLPRVLSDGVIALQYNISTSELVGSNDGFEQFTIDGNQIQLPSLNTRAFTQQVMIPNGHTLVLSGFEETTSRVDKEGLGRAENWLTGGRQSASLEREVMVIMITPVILDTGNVIERVD